MAEHKLVTAVIPYWNKMFVLSRVYVGIVGTWYATCVLTIIYLLTIVPYTAISNYKVVIVKNLYWNRTETVGFKQHKEFIPIALDLHNIKCRFIMPRPYSNSLYSGTAEQLCDWGGGAPLVTRYWGGGGGSTRHFFSLRLYNFKNILGGTCFPCPPPPPPPYSVVPVTGALSLVMTVPKHLPVPVLTVINITKSMLN